MQTDLFGKKRYKINLHTHTTLSDGHRTPEEVARIYAEQGYDAVAFTDHWYCGKEQTLSGVKILGNGEITKKLTLKANVFSASAQEKIEAAGGKAEVI